MSYLYICPHCGHGKEVGDDFEVMVKTQAAMDSTGVCTRSEEEWGPIDEVDVCDIQCKECGESTSKVRAWRVENKPDAVAFVLKPAVVVKDDLPQPFVVFMKPPLNPDINAVDYFEATPVGCSKWLTIRRDDCESLERRVRSQGAADFDGHTWEVADWFVNFPEEIREQIKRKVEPGT